MKRLLLVFVVGVLCSAAVNAAGLPSGSGETSARTRISFNHGWQFSKQDLDEESVEAAEKPDFDDTGWRTLDLPHDWGIEGPFTEEVDAAEGRLPFPGIGWYRKAFKAPPEGKRVFVEFDGVMRDARVWLNGEYVGGWPYGYSSFSFELTPYLRYGERRNVLAVRCENEGDSSRWYPGSGIYRNVWLTIVEPVHVAHWGTYVTTPEVSDSKAIIRIRTEVENQTSESKDIAVETTVVDAMGKKVGVIEVSGSITANGRNTFVQTLIFENPTRWDVDNPYLYTAVTRVKTGGELTDENRTPFGIRTFRFDADKGFFLNGRNMKIHGVNLHHGLGPLGTAVNRRAIERQLEIMKSLGCNAIRTAHNPPAPELLDLCDEMGLLVMDEAFDEWKRGKMPNAYHNIFDQWAEKDMRSMIRRDRNHPSIILWSIGNEIRELGSKEGAETARFLADICRDEDPTRPVSIGNSARYNRTAEAVKALDVVGWNYKCDTGEYDLAQRLHIKQVATETCALVSSRGVYFFPVKQSRMESRNGQVSSYDLTSLGFGGLPDDEFRAQEESPHVAGEFVWSGFDYLGEPEPCEHIARSTYFGIVDLCGFPKDRYYLYQSQWTDVPMVHLLPHWNWEGREGEITPVYVYTNCASAELFLNGKSLGRKKQSKGVYRLKWEDVKYEPGSIKVVAYDKDGKAVCDKEIKTAGKPAAIELVPDRKTIRADGCDLSFLTGKIVDKDGNFCPTADNSIDFTIDGPAQIAAVGSGDSMNYESFRADHHKAFNGLCLLVVRSERIPGDIKITAASDSLNPVSLTISTVETIKNSY